MLRYDTKVNAVNDCLASMIANDDGSASMCQRLMTEGSDGTKFLVVLAMGPMADEVARAVDVAVDGWGPLNDQPSDGTTNVEARRV